MSEVDRAGGLCPWDVGCWAGVRCRRPHPQSQPQGARGAHHGGQVHVLHPPVFAAQAAGRPRTHTGGRAVDELQQPVRPVGGRSEAGWTSTSGGRPGPSEPGGMPRFCGNPGAAAPRDGGNAAGAVLGGAPPGLAAPGAAWFLRLPGAENNADSNRQYLLSR